MLQKEKKVSADTFTTKTDNFKTTMYRGHQWFDFARKPIKLGHLNDRAHFYPMQIVALLTSRTNNARSSDTELR